MIRVLLDQGLPQGAAQLHRSHGIDAVHAGERGLGQAQDVDLIQLARDEGRAVVTLDSEFATLVATARAHSPSIVHVRLSGLNLRKTGDLLASTIDSNPGLREELDGQPWPAHAPGDSSHRPNGSAGSARPPAPRPRE